MMPATSGMAARTGPKEPPDEYARRAETLEEPIAAREQIGVAHEIPMLFEEMAEAPANPERDRIAKHRAENAADQERPDAQYAMRIERPRTSVPATTMMVVPGKTG